ncbi:hypothetical protein Mapa_016804 [Marchantia paleacea]|nr:hypothetical protein Mapa_016804 [Marchantia paleacea]
MVEIEKPYTTHSRDSWFLTVPSFCQSVFSSFVSEFVRRGPAKGRLSTLKRNK